MPGTPYNTVGLGTAAAPARVRTGDPVTAAAHNALVQRSIVSVGPGLNLTALSDGMLLSLFGASEFLKPARITAAPTQTDPPLIASAVVYSAVLIGQSTGVLVDVSPVYGRALGNTLAVEPAAVGDFCMVVTLPTDEGTTTQDLWILTERYLLQPCEGV